MEWAKGEMERRLVGLSATTMELKVVSIKGCTGDVSTCRPVNCCVLCAAARTPLCTLLVEWNCDVAGVQGWR
jgi:hypothetical protein